jgi:hypothetical protein
LESASGGEAHLEKDGDGGDTLGVGLVAMAEVTAVGQVQAHDAVVGVQQRCVHLEVGGRAGQRLHVHAPLLRIQPERLERPLLHSAWHQSVLLLFPIQDLSMAQSLLLLIPNQDFGMAQSKLLLIPYQALGHSAVSAAAHSDTALGHGAVSAVTQSKNSCLCFRFAGAIMVKEPHGERAS